ncbi:terminase large subunit [Caudoviricetes sp.]|nr:terminase large subunit [Caudoviricetes sp.]UOF81088.1 terminase large subunit [Caudoviricetes sp.]UOF82433.1 terminase large subunit [Caudoviricetes sp.]UOF82604.1 terminase large subunit [Caudoviricetes sp.]
MEQMRAQLLVISARDEDNSDPVQAIVDFGEYVFGKVANAHHREWIANDMRNRYTVTTAPPGSAKTTWQIIEMAWWMGKHPLHTNGIGSAGEDAADDMTEAVAQTIERNPRYREVFPHVVVHKERGWSADGYNIRDSRFSLEEWEVIRAGDKNPSLLGGGVGSARWNGFRVTGRLHLDDIHDRKSKHSEQICREAVEFVKDTAIPRLTDGAHISIRQTRWNSKDVVDWAGKLRKRDGTPRFAVFFTPAILPNGQSYWPENIPLADLLELREDSPVEFELVYQGNALAMDGNLLKKDKLIFFNHTLITPDMPRYMGGDWAIRTSAILGNRNRTSDEFSLCWFVDTGVGLVVEDGIAARLSQDEAENEFITRWMLVKPKSCYFENNSGGEVFYQSVMRRLNERGIHGVNLIPYNAGRGHNLIERVTTEMYPDFARGYVRVSDAKTPFLEKFVQQWVSFGNRSSHDDTLASAYGAWKAASHTLPNNQRSKFGRTHRVTNPWNSLGVQGLTPNG